MAPSHLVVVCCHGIWLGGPSKGWNEASWLIADFQRGETPTFIEHIKAGVECLANDVQNTALVFSGGPTRTENQLSEAQSYVNVAIANNFFDWDIPQQQQRENILIEDRALDSYQNILFSLTLFFSRFRTWPAHLTIVSHDFKRPRMVDGHCAAIGWPLGRATFRGIDPPSMRPGAVSNLDAMKGVALAVGEWTDDPHGRGDSLRGKRERRNQYGVWQGVFGDGEDDVSKLSGLATEGTGDRETLIDDAKRPWL